MKGKLGSSVMSMALKEADYKKTSPYEKNFAHKKKVQDPRFGDISII